MKIIHGTHEVHIHEALAAELERAKADGEEIKRVSAKTCSLADLELLLGEQNLFLKQKLYIIDQLHSLPKSTKKADLIAYLQKHQDDNLLLCERKDLTPTELKKFPQSVVAHFPTSSTLFKWLDCLGDEHTKKQALLYLIQAKESDGVGFCFAMLARQTRLLLQAKDGGQLFGPPYVQTKLRNQAKRFSLSQLLRLHRNLLQCDDQNKTGTTAVSLEQQLDLLTLSL
ncbi:MAG: hypothetical protein COU68_00305 [Candidatus Pacebacteria bacterium CG10_big_fil_rev_8_21_14_0_10_45_6]|nr:MAG: hypothetical protein COU68_00305 [Candidatus Pacebacteria bacterium CG10_big_fil_rev_8_21_14_0_10_45_6]